MEVDKNRLKRQHEALYNWYKNDYIGTMRWVTGTGKSFLAVLAMKHLLKRHGGLTTYVVVPTDYLRNQWRSHVEEFELPNVTVDTVHSFIGSDHACDFLILDEVHSYTGGDKFSTIFDCVKRQYTLGLTAQEREDDKDISILNANCPVVDVLDMEEALANGYVSEFTAYNLGLTLDKQTKVAYEKLHRSFIKYFSTFNFNLDLMFKAIGDDDYCDRLANEMNYPPKIIKIHAIQGNRVMQQRKSFLYSAKCIEDAAIDIIEKFPNKKIITFSEVTDTPDNIHKRLKAKGFNSGVYHSSLNTQVKDENNNLIAIAEKVNGKTQYRDFINDKLYTWKTLKFAYKDLNLTRYSDKRIKKQVISDYKEDKIDILNTARALNVGANIPGIDLAILCSFNGSTIDSIQRTGRAIRKVEGKRAIEANLYIKNSQSEKWLKNKQTKTPNVKWIDSIDQIV